jgi:hypothetical protein
MCVWSEKNRIRMMFSVILKITVVFEFSLKFENFNFLSTENQRHLTEYSKFVISKVQISLNLILHKNCAKNNEHRFLHQSRLASKNNATLAFLGLS